MRPLAMTALLLALAACDSRTRTRNSSGGELSEGAVRSNVGNIYRFVDVEQSLGDARKAMQAEHWADAQAAAQALLKQVPGHIEAQRINEQAGSELAAQPHFEAFTKALAVKDSFAIGSNFRALPETSVYFERARLEYERVREQWVALRETEARALVHAGRCRDAHRVARSANDTYPEMRPRLDLAADNCKPAAGQEAEPDPPPVMSPPIATLSPAGPQPPVPVPVPVAPERPDAAVAAAPPPPPPPPPVATPAPAAPAKPKLVPAMELEKLRVAGEKRPILPAGANMIAHRDHVASIVIGVSLCLTESGEPSAVELVKPSGYEDADEKVVHDVRSWRFQPYLADGRPVPVCTRMVFVYQME